MVGIRVRPLESREYHAAAELVAEVFSHNDVRQYERIYHRWLAERELPGFNLRDHRALFIDGRLVAHAMVKPYILTYGSARLHVLGVGRVCVHPEYRKRGYSSAVMRDTVAYMAEQGAHLALLNGISGYYERFGFSSVWPYYHVEFNTDAADQRAVPLTMRQAQPGDAAEMAALYERHWGGRVTLERSAALWYWRLNHERRGLLQVVEGKHGEICGYIAGDDWNKPITEIIVDTVEAAETILSVCAQHAAEEELPKVRWLMPPDDAMITFIRPLVRVTVSAEYRPSGGWMARLIDTHAMIDTLLPEIIAQVRYTDPEFDPGRLNFKYQSDAVNISLRGLPDSQCTLSYADFTQVIFGSLRPAALALRTHTSLKPAGVFLLEKLFPPRMAVMGAWDWF